MRVHRQQEVSRAASGTGAAASSEQIAPTHTVLLVDRNGNTRDFCKRELEREGYHVIPVADGRKAFTIVKQTPAEVLVLDIETSDLDELKMTQWALMHFADLPVIIRTANRCRPAELRNWPVQACVEKARDLTPLKEGIARVLLGKKTGKPGHAAGGQRVSRAP